MTGAVYDRGYRPYEGRRGGRASARAALLRASVRRALGIRREWRQKVAPFVLLAIAVVPAIVNVGVKYLTRDTPARGVEFITYRDYVGVSNALLVFVALTAPDIMCPDRRQRVLPLVFARPLTGLDYVVAKVGTMASILFAFSFIPQVVLFVGQMLVSNDGALDYLRDNAEVLWQVPTAVALLSLFYASIGVAISSLTTRRIVAGASIIALFLITSITSAILVGPQTTVVEGGDGSSGTVIVIPEQEEGFGSATSTTGFDAPPPQVGPRPFLVEIDADPSAAPLLNLAGLPLVLRDVVFLGEVDPDHPMSGLNGAGLYAAGVYVLVVAACLATLVVRYREVER
ncbi:MAG: ABC transporter permease [Actinomycetota bacterium]